MNDAFSGEILSKYRQRRRFFVNLAQTISIAASAEKVLPFTTPPKLAIDKNQAIVIDHIWFGVFDPDPSGFIEVLDLNLFLQGNNGTFNLDCVSQSFRFSGSALAPVGPTLFTDATSAVETALAINLRYELYEWSDAMEANAGNGVTPAILVYPTVHAVNLDPAGAHHIALQCQAIYSIWDRLP